MLFITDILNDRQPLAEEQELNNNTACSMVPKENRQRLMCVARGNLMNYFGGKLRNAVNNRLPKRRENKRKSYKLRTANLTHRVSEITELITFSK